MCSPDVNHDDYMLCPQCDMLVELPALRYGQKAVCPRCKTTLTRRQPQARQRALGYAFSALLMLVLSNFFPFVYMRIAGITSEISLFDIPQVMALEDYPSVALLFLLFVQIIPALSMLMLIALCLRARLPLAVKRVMATWVFLLKSWGMTEIFLAGVLVSFVKLMAYGDLGVGSGFIPYVMFCVLQLMAYQSLDRRKIWNAIAPAPLLRLAPQTGRTGLAQGLRSCSCCSAILPADTYRCPRCHRREHARRKHSVQWTMALLITSLVLYIPSNLLPIMVTEALGDRITSTIMSGVILLWGMGSYPVALVIFIASIMVPTLKMLALGWLCWSATGKGRQDNERLHVVYEMVEFVGRWSMIDVFVIAVLSSMVRIGKLMSIYPAIGALLFALVVIITMIAAMTFDPRLLWDRQSDVHQSDVHQEEPAIGGK